MGMLDALLGINAVWQLEFLLGLLLRSALILVACAAATTLMRNGSANARHAIWSVGLIILLVLPFASFETRAQVVLQSPTWLARIDNTPAAGGPGVFGWLVTIWTAVAGLLLLRLVIGLLGVRRIVKNGAVAPLSLQVHIARANTAIEPRLIVAETGVAFTVGWLRPLIVLPPAALEWPDDVARTVILHELAHVQRRDWLRQMTGEVAASLYWFQPGIRMAMNRAALEAELACDDAVVARGVARRSYATHLLAVVCDGAPQRPLAMTIPFARASEIEERITRVLAPRTGRARRALALAGAVLVLIAAPASAIVTTSLGPCEADAVVRVEWVVR